MRGLEAVLQDAIAIASSNTAGYGVSFDLDCIDPSFVSAVGTPVPGGIDEEELFSCLHLFQRHFPLAFELVEYNPFLDPNLATFRFIHRLLKVLEEMRISSHSLA